MPGKRGPKMRNKQGIMIAAAVVLLGIGVIGTMSVNAAKKGKVSFVIGGNVELRNTIELPLSETECLEVIYTSKNLKVYPEEGDSIIIKEYLLSGSEQALASVEREGKSVVVRGGREQTITLFGFFAGMERIEIYVPREGLASLSLETGSGNITAKDGFSLDVQKLQVRAKSGNIKWADTKAQEYEIQANSGNVSVDHMEGGGRAQTTSGNIRLRQVKGRLEANANSGNITVESFSGSGSVQTTSGNVKVEADEVTGDIRAGAHSGNVRLILPHNLSFETRIQTGSGIIRTSFDESLSYNREGDQAHGTVGDTPSCVIEAQTTSGNVHISAE